MPRKTFIWCPVERRMVPKTQEQRGASAPFVVSDSMDATWHPADGKKYDSKSKFRRMTRAAGYTEIGNERQQDSRRVERVTKQEIARAIEQVRAGYRPRIHND